MRYYFNIGLNLCADEAWVADYLFVSGQVDSRELALAALNEKREFCGWFECEVSNTIEEAMRYGT